MSELVTKSIIEDLGSTNSSVRRKTLTKCEEALLAEQKLRESQDNNPELCLLKSFCDLFPTFLTALTDKSEVNRVLTCNIFVCLFKLGAIKVEHIGKIISVLYHRLGSEPTIEKSEEVRLGYIEIISEFIKFHDDVACSYINDVTNILKLTVVVNDPDLQVLSCKCVQSFAFATRTKFHLQSESLVKPLLKVICFRRFKSRVAAIDALGSVLLYGDGSCIKDVAGPLAQKVMDMPQVRLAVVTVGGKLALDMKDRYSYWRYILPIILPGLRDSDSDVQKEAQLLWSQVGDKYEQENEERLKDELNYDVIPDNFPDGVDRYRLGCRILVQQNIYYLLPGLMTDLADWQEGPRLQAVRLLVTLVLNAESGVTQYAEKIMNALIFAVGDEELIIRNEALLCGKYLGAFLRPSTLFPLIFPQLGSDKTEHSMALLSSLLKGLSLTDFQENSVEIIAKLSSSDVLYSLQPQQQRAALDIVNLIYDNCDIGDDSYGIFCILMMTMGVPQSPELHKEAKETMDKLSQKINEEGTSNLYDKHLPTLLNNLLINCQVWGEYDPEFLIFQTLLNQAGSSLGTQLELITKILVLIIPRKNEAMVTLRCFTLLRELLNKEDTPLNSQRQLHLWLPSILSECLLPFLIWHPGKTKEALRTAAIAAFSSVCCVSVSHTDDILEALKKPLGLLPSLIEDECQDTRLFACKIINDIAQNYNILIDSDGLYILADKLVKRFDDVSPIVRKQSALTLADLFRHLPDGHDPILQSARLQGLCQDAVIFLDDPDNNMQQPVYDALLQIGKASPEQLVSILERDAEKYRNKELCEKLLTAVKTISIQ